jgi:signal peptidase I
MVEETPHTAQDEAPYEPYARPAPPQVVMLALTHGGLATVDPWAPEPRPLSQVIWPWGLGGLAETLEVIALALIMFVAVRSVAHNYRVEGSSMVPTFQNNQLLIVNRLAYKTLDFSWLPGAENNALTLGTPRRGDVVVFIAQTTPAERDFIKRIIGLPGDTVQVKSGHVIVNGVAYDESYIESPPTYDYAQAVVPPGKVFVLGDNRNNSLDSHIIGMVDQSSIIGRVDLRYWPFNAMGVIHSEFGTTANTKEAPRSP